MVVVVVVLHMIVSHVVEPLQTIGQAAIFSQIVFSIRVYYYSSGIEYLINNRLYIKCCTKLRSIFLYYYSK